MEPEANIATRNNGPEEGTSAMTEQLCIKRDGEGHDLQPLHAHQQAQPVAWVHAACLKEYAASNTLESVAARAADDAEMEARFIQMMEQSRERRGQKRQ
jgi:hypothetical protein